MRLKFPCIVVAIGISLIANTAQAANPEHLAQLLNTKECQGCDLSGADLIGADLVGAKLQGANLNAANLTGADLSNADLTKASLAGSSLVGANLQRAILTEASFAYANLALAQLNNAVLNKTDLQAANLAGVNFTGAKVTKSSLVGANLYKVTAVNNPIYKAANSNLFKGGINVDIILTNTPRTLDQAASEPPNGEENGMRTFRRYRIPLWIGKPIRSTAGAVRFYKPRNPDLDINIW